MLAKRPLIVASSIGVLATLFACGSSSTNSGDGGGGSSGGGDDSGSGGLPTVSISSPAMGDMVTLMPPTDAVPIAFSVTNFTLMAPGSCGTMANCGHLHVLVDGPACTPDGAPYDNAATGPSPTSAILSTCPMANGSHTVTLEVHHDDHSPFNGANGMVISASVTFTASGG